MLAGNHDHGLAAGWIDARLQTEPAGFLGLEQRFAPTQAGPLAAARSPRRARAGARCSCAYPGLWLRDDVYALHGHYADLHATVPTFERLAAGAMARFVAQLPGEGATPDDYEAVLAPLYAWLHALTQRPEQTPRERRRAARRRAPGSRSPGPTAASARCARSRSSGGYAAAVAGAQRDRPRPARPPASRRPRCAAATCTAIREVDARGSASTRAHVIWGHSHRSGPWPADDPAEWRAARRRASSTPARGSTSRTSSRRAGAARPTGRAPRCSSRTSGPPRLLRLLGDRGARRAQPATTRGEAGGVDARRPRRARARARPRVWRPCSISGTQPGCSATTARPLTAQLARDPSTTAQTPPASYGPE